MKRKVKRSESRKSREKRRRSPRSSEAARLELLGDTAVAAGNLIQGLRAYDDVIGMGLATSETWQKTGNALIQVKEFAQAVGAFENALKLAPSRPDAHHNLAKACNLIGEVDRAINHLRQATQFSEQIDSWQGMANIIANAPGSTHTDVLQVRQALAERLLATKVQNAWRKPTTNGTIRVAYLSAHFAGRNYMKPVWGLINHHNRNRVQVFLLSDAVVEAPFACYRIDSRDTIFDVSGDDDDSLARRIEELEIDILVDLSAFSHPSRLSFFARKIAPITVAWFNMFATSGLPGFDYIVGDRHVILPEEESFYCEQVMRLPTSYLTFQVDYPVPDVAPSPCRQSGQFTFGSLVSLYKITPPVLDVWAEILRNCPSARLVLANADLKSPHNRDYIAEQFEKRGVPRAQLDFYPPADHDTFLRYYDQIDLALDAFPYNGGTTTMEAIWQGVPVMTKEGDRWAARTSLTLLRECHLGNFVARDSQDYCRRCIRWATDPALWQKLATLRSEMRERLQQSSVCDCPSMALAMEEIYDQMISAWTD